ncbi:hypothetical protein [Bdellovibrio sp. HCB337]
METKFFARVVDLAILYLWRTLEDLVASKSSCFASNVGFGLN